MCNFREGHTSQRSCTYVYCYITAGQADFNTHYIHSRMLSCNRPSALSNVSSVSVVLCPSVSPCLSILVNSSLSRFEKRADCNYFVAFAAWHFAVANGRRSFRPSGPCFSLYVQFIAVIVAGVSASWRLCQSQH